MKYTLVNATNNDIDYLKKSKLYNIFSYAHNLSEWVYKENIKAISLYKRFGFNVKEETDTKYYMMYKE